LPWITDVLAGALAPFSDRIAAAFVFGSMANANETAGSDVDLLIIGDVGFSEIARAVYSSQEVLGREINPKVYSKEALLLQENPRQRSRNIGAS
jgi:predicted nucleotidyltransferase